MMAAVHVLALYDIHGNIDALEAVLDDPRSQDPDAIVIGGDVVPGPFARATLERLAELDGTHWIRGNGEREVAEAVDGPEPDPGDMAAVTAKLTAAELGGADSRRLGELPTTLELDGVLYCHATPRRDDEMVTRLSTPERWATVLSATTAELVVAGHTHQQDDRVVGSTRFVNAGSVGLPYEGDGAARWLWIADGVPELRKTAYDAKAAGERMRDRWPDVRSIGAALIEPMEPTEITKIFESLTG
jgi:predicted phosphodiesterase